VSRGKGGTRDGFIRETMVGGEADQGSRGGRHRLLVGEAGVSTRRELEVVDSSLKSKKFPSDPDSSGVEDI